MSHPISSRFAPRCVKKLTHRGVPGLAFALALGSGPATAQHRTPPAERFPVELDGYLARVLIDWQIPGFAIAVVRNDSVMVAKGYGVRELGKPAPVDENTVFDIASLNKAFTSTAAAILVDRALLRWDDPVRRHLPGLVLPNEDLAANATVRDFLSHRAGLEPANMMWVLTAVDRKEVLKRVRHLRVVAPLRQEMIYSNVGYTVAGEALAAASGTTFEAMIRDLVIKPLGLTSTTSSYEQAGRMPNVATAHATIAGRQQPIRRETQRHSTAPAGAVQSTVSDLTRWMRLHLNRGILDGTRFVSDSTMREMQSIQIGIATTPGMRAARMVQDSVVGYGLGWNIMDYRGHPVIWHTGNGNGQIAYMALLPRDRLGVVVLVNTWSAPFVHGALLSRMLDVYLGYEPRDWAGEALARVPAMTAEADSARRALEEGKRAGPPPRALTAYAGRFDEPRFGPIFVGAESSGLVLQMGEGQKADLEYHHDDVFLVRWRDPLYRESFGTHVHFNAVQDTITSFRIRINRDEFTATKSGSTSASAGPIWRSSWPGTEMAVISGDPFATGPFVFRFRMPDGYWICPHTHPVHARLKVISGTLLVGMGTRLDPGNAKTLGQSREIALEAGMAHFEGTRGETVIEIQGQGPWGITFLNPADDPARPGGRGCKP